MNGTPEIQSGGGAMRDLADTMTAEIPGIEPPLPKKDAPPPTICRRRELCGYNPPKLAPSCRHCLFKATAARSGLPWCTKHEFVVELGAICGDWTAA